MAFIHLFVSYKDISFGMSKKNKEETEKGINRPSPRHIYIDIYFFLYNKSLNIKYRRKNEGSAKKNLFL